MSSLVPERHKESGAIFPGEPPAPQPFGRPGVISTSQTKGAQLKPLDGSLTRPRSSASSLADSAVCSSHLFHIRLSDEMAVKRPKLINIYDLCSFISVAIAPTCSLSLSQGNVTFSCEESLSVAVTFPGPRSFLQVPGARRYSSGGTVVSFQFRTWNEAGLLLAFALAGEGGVAWLYLSEATLRLQLGAGRAGGLRGSSQNHARWLRDPRPLGAALSDGQWHTVELSHTRGRLTVSADGHQGGVAHAGLFVAAGSPLFFGGETGVCLF